MNGVAIMESPPPKQAPANGAAAIPTGLANSAIPTGFAISATPPAIKHAPPTIDTAEVIKVSLPDTWQVHKQSIPSFSPMQLSLHLYFLRQRFFLQAEHFILLKLVARLR